MVTTSLINPKPYPLSKDKYKVSNWPSYNEGLKQRGVLTLWLSADMVKEWEAQNLKQKSRGGQPRYSEVAIETCLMLRKVYHLPLRQTEGFVSSIFAALKIGAPVPDYTTLSRRSNGLTVKLSAAADGRFTDLVVDSTGLKLYGEGEWKVRKHGADKHRTWMKLHIGVDGESQQIEAFSLTTNAVDDAAEVPGLLKQVRKPLRSFRGDGAYDKDKVRKALYTDNIEQVIPPQHNAVVDRKKSKHRKQRDEAIEAIKHIGRAAWKVQRDYHRRSLAETVMFRYKTIIGGSLCARKTAHQKTEVAVGCKILNIMLQTAKPKSYKVA